MGVPAMNAVGGRISQATIDAVRERADLVELVEARTGPGRPSRGQMMLRCPFHDERTPVVPRASGRQALQVLRLRRAGRAVRLRPEDREPDVPRGRRVAGRPVRRRGRARGPVARRPRPARSRQARRRSARRRHLLLRALPGARGGERGRPRLPGRARRVGRVDRALPARASRRPTGTAWPAPRSRRATRPSCCTRPASPRRAAAGRSTASAGASRSRSATPVAACAGSARG